jgi:hypothetical protein
MVINYNESTIYKLCCKDVTVKEIYVGSTTNFIRRKAQHKSVCNNNDSNYYNYYVYQFIREHGGFKNWDMIEVEKYDAKDKKDLQKRERFFIETLEASLNNRIPTRTKKEYYTDNKEKISEDQKKYYEVNKEKIIEHNKKYYEDNKEKILEDRKKYHEDNKEKISEYQKKYHEANKEHLSEYKKKYHEDNKEKILEKITCECGSVISKKSLPRHIKTEKHQKNI